MARAVVLTAIAVAIGCSRTPAPAAEADARFDADAPAMDAASVDAATEGWRDVAGAADFAEPGAPRIVLEVRHAGGSGCGGGGCSTSVDARALGLLPSRSFGYYYPDRLRVGTSRACPDAADLARLFDEWTAIAIAPAKGTAEQRPSCGLTTTSDASMRYWVIVRIGAVNTAR